MINNALKSKLEKSIEKAECNWRKPKIIYFIDYKNEKYLVTSSRNKKKSEELEKADLSEIVEEIAHQLIGSCDWKRYIDIKCSSRVPEKIKNALFWFRLLCDSYVDVSNSDKIKVEYINHIKQTLSNIKRSIEKGEESLEDQLPYNIKHAFDEKLK